MSEQFREQFRVPSTIAEPVVVDLCCGAGGWTDPFLDRGLRVVGYDIYRHPEYRGELVIGDVLKLQPEDLPEGVVLIVASPPCEEFSRHSMPWTRKRNPPEPDLRLVKKAFELGRAIQVPLVLENVRAAQKWLGPAVAHWGPFYLWGDGVPALLPYVSYRAKESYSSKDRAARARIPELLADWVAEVHAA